MSEFSPASPAEWRRSPEAKSVHVAGTDYERLFAEAKSDREQAALPPELRGFPAPHHLEPIEADPQAQQVARKFGPSEREMQLEADLLELRQWGKEGNDRLEDHWDKVKASELEVQRLQEQRKAAWREELRPILLKRMDELAKLPFIDARSYKPDLARHPSVTQVQPVHLDRVIYVGRFGDDWSGRTATHTKRAEGGRRKGENLPSNEYVLEVALDIATGEFDPDDQKLDKLECVPVTLPDGEVGFVMNGGAHRVAALKLLGRQTANFLVTWPA